MDWSIYDISYTQQIIVCALYNRKLYGLAIRNHIKKASNNVIIIEPGSLYPALKRLEKMGIVKACWGDEILSERKGARRRYYTLTYEGERMFNEINDFFYRLQNLDSGLEPT